MERNFNLIKNEFGHHEKRVLPRFPFCYLTFKATSGDGSRAFEVKDISHTGMQLALRDGKHNFISGTELEGILHWHGDRLVVKGSVKWVTPLRLGLEFTHSENSLTAISAFLSTEKIASSLRAIHDTDMEIEVPNSLKYWLRADGPMEFFIWQHDDGEISNFQVLLMEKFVEWKDGVGLRTGRVISKRDVDTPLVTEDEFVFQINQDIGQEEIDFALEVIDKMNVELLSSEIIDFIKMKLHHTNN